MIEARRICVVTGSRADYGLLSGLLRRLKDDPVIDLRVLATGMHLHPDFGLTYQEIESDGFTVIRVPLPLDGRDNLQAACALGQGTTALAEILAQLEPHIVVMLGDRIELLAVSAACLVLGIPMAHIHGGEITEGAIDDAIRHAVTKMAHLHFPAAETYSRRILQMGEPADRVITTGALGVDNVADIPAITRDALQQEIGFIWQTPLLVVTYHPETSSDVDPETGCSALLAALDAIPDAYITFTMANADPGGRIVNRKIEDWIRGRERRARLFPSLGVRRYLSLLRYADAVVGNSSSGIIEAPALGIPTVNIGDRQKGRLRASSIIDCPPRPDAIAEAIRRALSAGFRRQAAADTPPYGRGGAAARIHAALRDWPLAELRRKRFIDWEPRGEA